mgnify:CR=1 FL=1
MDSILAMTDGGEDPHEHMVHQILARFATKMAQQKTQSRIQQHTLEELGTLDGALEAKQRFYVRELEKRPPQSKTSTYFRTYKRMYPNVRGIIGVEHCSDVQLVEAVMQPLQQQHKEAANDVPFQSDIQLAYGTQVYLPDGQRGAIKSSDAVLQKESEVVVMSRGLQIWKGDPSELALTTDAKGYPFPAVYDQQDDVHIARRRGAMRDKNPDKAEAQKASPPTLPTTWTQASSVKYARDVVLNFQAYLDSSPGKALSDRAFTNAWKNSLAKAKDKHSHPWLEDVVDILQRAATNSWDFRETLYDFCYITNVRAEPKALIEVYRNTTQKKGQQAILYIKQMQIQSSAILSLLGGTKAALEMATDGLVNRQLQVLMRREMASGNCPTFQSYITKLQEIVESCGIPQPQQHTKAQNKDTTDKPSENQDKGRRKNSWQRRRDSDHDQAKTDETVRHVQSTNQTTSDNSEKKETYKEKCFRRWEAKLKEMSGKSLAQQREMAKELVDKIVAEAKRSRNLDPIKIQKDWDKIVEKHFNKKSNTKPSFQKGK